MKKLINSFEAIDESGTTYTIDTYQTYETVSDLSGKTELAEGYQEHFYGAHTVLSLAGSSFYIRALDTEVKKVG